MLKKYLQVEEQIKLLQERGMTCDDATARLLLREGYYSVVNGYGKPFLDARATREVGEDRYLPGTAFDHVYSLFCFDRELRELTFGMLSRVEGMLRSVVAAAFLEAHPEANSYLQEESYSTKQHYLLDHDSYDTHLRHLLTTLSRYANEHERDERGRDDARLAHYRNNYDAVPLWVVFSDFSYGNLHHFVALMKMDEQEATCRRIAHVLASDDTKPREARSRQGLVRDMALQVEVRNMCAHGERLYDAVRYDQFARMMGRFLTNEDYATYRARLADLLARHTGISERLDRTLSAAHMIQAVQG